MDRRTFIAALVALSACSEKEKPTRVVETPGPAPLAAAQAARIPRVTILYFGSGTAQYTDMFRRRLSELGYVEGKNVLIDERFAGGDSQRLAQIARELAASKVDVIVAAAFAATAAAQQATNTIPIVMVHAGTAGSGLIASLAYPGGNVTGTTNLAHGGKEVDLIRELVPRAARIAILINPTNRGHADIVSSATDAARKFNIGATVAEVTRAEDFPNALTAIRNAQPDGLIVAVEPLIVTHGAKVIEFAATAHLPAIYDLGDMARQGGLIAYATMYIEHYALAADYVDRILKGAKPADLPVQQPARFELVINMKTAKALGLTVPLTLQVAADEVIE